MDTTSSLQGSRAILAHVAQSYVGPPRSALAPGTVVALALDADSGLLGQGRLRGLPGALDPSDQADAVRSIVGPLVSDPRGAQADSIVLCVFRSGRDGPTESDAGWWSALSRVCRERDLIPADVICRTPGGWHAVQAGSSGVE